MSKEKQIEEITKLINTPCNDRPHDNCYEYGCLKCQAGLIYNAGYRKQSEWISVEERVPEHLEKVLVYDEMGNMNTAMFLRYNNGNVDWCTSVRLTCQATHWMPLPEAPKMKGVKELNNG